MEKTNEGGKKKKKGTRNYHHDVGKKMKRQRKRRHHSKSGKNKNGTKENKSCFGIMKETKNSCVGTEGRWRNKSKGWHATGRDQKGKRRNKGTGGDNRGKNLGYNKVVPGQSRRGKKDRK
jgi:hypothetical protein